MTDQLVQGGRPIAKFRVLGFPVTIDISFVIVMGVLGWTPGVTGRDFVLWMLIVPLAVLTHELGHALVARPTGASPAIALAGLGGVTTYVPPRPLSRGRALAISLAGPAVGLVLGGVLLAYARNADIAPFSLLDAVLRTAIFTTLGWSVLNLLPIVPLDGGQALRELLPGAPAVREVRAAVVSIVAGVAVAAFALYFSLVFGALLVGFLVFTNVMTIRDARREGSRDVSQRLVQMLWSGRPDDARALLAAKPDDAGVHPLVRAAVRAVGEDPAGGQAVLEAAAAQDPDDPSASAMLLLVYRVRQDWEAALELVRGPYGSSLHPSAVLAAQTVAFREGAHSQSALIGEAFLDRTRDGDVDGAADEAAATVAYNAACGWARAGEEDRAVAAFRRAAELGFADLKAVDSDADLAPLRPRADYDEARQVIRGRALAQLDAEDGNASPP
jgi:Zn-dependent protease